MNDLHSAHTNQMSNFINKQQMVHLISQRIVDYGCTKYFLNTLYKAAIVTMKRASYTETQTSSTIKTKKRHLSAGNNICIPI